MASTITLETVKAGKSLSQRVYDALKRFDNCLTCCGEIIDNRKELATVQQSIVEQQELICRLNKSLAHEHELGGRELLIAQLDRANKKLARLQAIRSRLNGNISYLDDYCFGFSKVAVRVA